LKRRLCRNNADCPFFPKNVCSNTHCVKPGESCTSDDQCLKEGRRRCVISTCIRLDLPCTFDQDCPFYPFTYCHENECVKTELNATILQNPILRGKKSWNRENHRKACFQTTLNDELRDLLVKIHNDGRRKTARRMHFAADRGKNKTAKALYELKYNCKLDMASIVSISDCLNISSIKPGVNVFQVIMPSPITTVEQVVRSAVKSWCWNCLSRANKTTDAMSHANIVYHKTLSLGCAYRFCSGTTPTKHVLLCHYSDK
ncbi:SCP-like protein, partial [Ancylostoma caninum]